MAYAAPRYYAPRYWAVRYFNTGVIISSFPVQYGGLRVYNDTILDLCLVAEADAPPGDQLRILKNGTVYVVYLVDTTDPNASPVFLMTSDGIKAIRLKTA